MSRPVIITPEAERQLLENAEWWAENRSVAQAERWYDGFVSALERLGEHPEECSLARENHRFPYELRELHFGIGSHPTHRALYVIRPEGVFVVSIRHTSQQDVTPNDL